jgi:hypothetical protein
MHQRGGLRKTWVVGIGKEPRERLFTTHRVRKVGDCWILMHAQSVRVARKVRTFLVDVLGLSVGPARDEPAADFVYAYKKSTNTKP